MSLDARTGRLRAFAHPLRLRIMSVLTAEAGSAAEVARRIGCTQANASYHIRVLHAAGLLQVVERTSVRGGQAVRYQHHPLSGEQVKAGGQEGYQLLAEAMAEELRRRSNLRERNVPGVVTDAELHVLPSDWAAFLATVRAASRRLHSAARPAGSPGTVRTSTTIAAFRMRKGQ
jgi:DNA-binding transcriptional ArsR family regulator